ncbi:MAG: helix-turn-helix transcriptional regulator [Rhizobacter sp.]|nr:helix-turn-helix transcriptional regulator [Chlorobiales bacterium]
MSVQRKEIYTCPVEATLGVVGGKWKILVMYHLQSGAKRYGALRRLMPEVTEKVLSENLKALESDRLLIRTVHYERPPRVEYQATDIGKRLMPLIESVNQWGHEYLKEINHAVPEKAMPPARVKKSFSQSAQV